MDKESVAFRLEAIRISYDLPKKEFAQAIGLDPSSYSKVLTGAKVLKAEYALSACQEFNVTMDYIYRGIEADVPHRVIQAARTNTPG